jgi:hypothetical protein
MPMMFFYFLKIIFDISTSKRSKKYKPHSILEKKKFKFGGNAGTNTVPNVPLASWTVDMVLDWSVNEYKFTQLSFLIDIFLYIKKYFLVIKS